ncbi:MAG: hypothetical protein L0220_22410 [Acidobacteria bacterium]|nr:hypothetical protein [Acidobacteriota bacterium]
MPTESGIVEEAAEDRRFFSGSTNRRPAAGTFTQAPEVIARSEALWKAWMNQHFPRLGHK